MNQAQLAQPSRRRRAQHDASELERGAARVTLAWTPGHHDGVSRSAPTEVELVMGLPGDLNPTWTWSESHDSNWLEAVRSARCSEVVLTARLGNNPSAKHRVLELAELLTFKLIDSQPLIRVLFLPAASAPRGVASHA